MENQPFKLGDNYCLELAAFRHHNKAIVAGFTTRNGGFSLEPYNSLNLGLHVGDQTDVVVKNRQSIADKIGIPLDQWVFADQVHGNKIATVTRLDCGKGTVALDDAIQKTDGLYTKEPNILLASLYADCVPLYFFDKKNKMIGLAHAGWKGTVSKIGARMIEHWVKEEQSDLSDIYVAIGPAISKQYYEVDDFIIDKINHLEITSSNLYKRIREGKYLLDLKLVNLHLLLKAGIKEHNIFISDYCTYKEKELFYSYRRNNRTGRMISYICLHSDDS